MGNKNSRSTQNPSTSATTNSSITRDILRPKSESNDSNTIDCDNETIAAIVQILLLSDVFEFDSSGDEEEEETEGEKSGNYKLSQTVIQSLLNGGEEAMIANKQIRQCIDKGNRKGFDEEVEKTVLKCLTNFLKDQNQKLLMSTLQTLRKISANTRIRLTAMNNCDFGPVLSNLLINRYNDDSICFSVLNIITNISSDGDKSREYLLNSGILEPIIKCCEPSDGLLSNLKLDQSSNALLTICSTDGSQNFAQIESCIPCLVKILENHQKEEMSAKASITLCLIFNNTDEGKDYILNAQILKKLQKNLFTESECLLKASCVVLQKICGKLSESLDLYLDANVIQQIKHLMTSHENIVIKTLLNFTVANVIQLCHIHDIHSVLDLFIDQKLCHHLGLVLRSEVEEYVISGIGLIQSIFGGNYNRIREEFNELFMSGENPLLPQLITRFDSFRDKNEELSVFLKAFLNMASDGDYCRDQMLSLGIIDRLLDVIKRSQYSCIQIKTICVIRQLCNYSVIPPEFELIKSCVPIFKDLLTHPDPEVIAELVRAIANIARSSLDGKQAIIESEMGPNLVQFMVHENNHIANAAIAAIVHLSIGSSGPLGQTLNINPYPILFEMLLSNEELTVERVCLSLQAIMISNVDHIQEAIDSNIFSLLISLMNNATFEIKITAMNTVFEAISVATPLQINRLVDEGIIGSLSGIAFIEDEDQAIKLLESFRSILKVGEIFGDESSDRMNLYSLMIAESGGLESILTQRWRENQTISKIASEIISRYYPELSSDNNKPIESSEPKPSTSGNDNECQICFSRPRNCLFLPCRHVFMCFECSREMIAFNAQNITNKCPICRTIIKESIEMILS